MLIIVKRFVRPCTWAPLRWHCLLRCYNKCSPLLFLPVQYLMCCRFHMPWMAECCIHAASASFLYRLLVHPNGHIYCNTSSWEISMSLTRVRGCYLSLLGTNRETFDVIVHVRILVNRGVAVYRCWLWYAWNLCGSCRKSLYMQHTCDGTLLYFYVCDAVFLLKCSTNSFANAAFSVECIFGRPYGRLWYPMSSVVWRLWRFVLWRNDTS